MLEKEITSLKKDLIEYAALVEGMIKQAIKGLLNKDREILCHVAEEEEPRANELEIGLDDICTTLIAKYQPTAKNLRTILMIYKMNNDLERMADLAVNMVESSLFLIEKPFVKPFIDIPHMSNIAVGMLKDSLDSFTKEDAVLAKRVCERDNDIDALRDQVYRELITHMISDPATIERCLHVIRISNSLERIADLSTNICEDVIYMVEGRVIKHHREE
ncbi:MAG: phosphate signaling complex protein PhoU [Candidatus Aminicenantes bacterium]